MYAEARHIFGEEKMRAKYEFGCRDENVWLGDIAYVSKATQKIGRCILTA